MRRYSARSGTSIAGEFLDTERVGPVVSHRAKIIEPVGVWHRAEVTGVLADFLVIAMQITEDRFEFTNHLAIERDVHPKHAVSGWMLRPHRDFEQFAFEPRAHAQRRPLHGFDCFNDLRSLLSGRQLFSAPSNCGRAG